MADAATSSITVDKVFETFKTSAATAADNLNKAITAAGASVNDPTNLITMQKELANYNMALMVQSSVVKSIEETGKSITQKL